MAARIAMARMDPMEFLRSRDQTEVVTMLAIANAYHRLRAEASEQ